MTSQRLIIACATALTTCGALLWAKSPTFESRHYTMRVAQYASEVSITHEGRRAGREYAVSLGSVFIEPVDEIDAVAISDELGAISATDARGKRLLAESTKPSDEFNAFTTTGVAESELRKAELTANPYLVEEMQVDATVIVASKRQTIDLTAEVMEQAARAPGGMTLRIESMEIQRDGRAKLAIEYTRPNAAGAAFLERVDMLDDEGEVIGGDRWVKGNPFDDHGTWQSEFTLNRGSKWAQVRCTVLTGYTMENVKFTVDGVFQD